MSYEFSGVYFIFANVNVKRKDFLERKFHFRCFDTWQFFSIHDSNPGLTEDWVGFFT